MKLKPVLTIAAIYLGVLGLGFMFAPREIGAGAGFGGSCLGVAVLVIHLLMTVGFVVARRATVGQRRVPEMRTSAAAALIILAAACTDGATLSSAARRRALAERDSAFAAVQSRGKEAMGVDQYTSTHRFTPLPDGGRIELQRDQVDTSGTRQIRQHMHQIAAAFQSGNFELPGFVHDREVPGTTVMAAKRDAITYTVEPLPGGAALRLRTGDSTAIQAIHAFLAFQRADHHAGAH